MSASERIERRGGRGIVVRGDDIDTDQIIPARYMRSFTFSGLEEYVFADARRSADDTPKDHPFNEERFLGASILAVNRNFGCGSSREHAPQALMRWGIHALVGESFGEIFFGNCVAMGLVAATAAGDDVAALMDAIELDPTQEVTLDLLAMTVSSRAGTARISLPEGARRQLLDGNWDATHTLLREPEAIRQTAAGLPYLAGF